MSREVDKKQSAAPAASGPRPQSSSSSSSLTDLSGDDGYSDLDGMAADDDEDEEDVSAAEAEHMISYEVDSSPRPAESSGEGDDEGESDDEYGDSPDLHGRSWREILSDQEIDAAIAGDDAHILGPGAYGERHVRWAVPEAAGGDTTSDDDDDLDDQLFPDIFLAKSELDPAFRRAIERDDYDSSSSSGSFWDTYECSEEPNNGQAAPTPPVTAPSSGLNMGLFGLDGGNPMGTALQGIDTSAAFSTPMRSPEDEDPSEGYESDLDGGDTTEEEDPPEPIRRKPRQEAAAEASDSDAVELIRPRRGKPGVALEKLDFSGKKKPIAILNKKTGKLMIFTAPNGLDLSPEAFAWDNMGDASYLDTSFDRPGFPYGNGNASEFMLSGMMPGNTMVSTGTFGDFMNTHSAGSVDALLQIGGTTMEDSSEEVEDTHDEEEKILSDWLDLGSSSDDDMANLVDEDDVFEATPLRPGTTPAPPSDVDHLFENGKTKAGIVGSFRRDQMNGQLIRNGKATRDSLSFSSPIYQGTLRGIKDGRIAETNTPITPLRKQKRMMTAAAGAGDMTLSSPLGGGGGGGDAAPPGKRKAPFPPLNGGDQKRHRSISDMNSLHL